MWKEEMKVTSEGQPEAKESPSRLPAWPLEDPSARPLQASDLLKVQEDPLALQVGRSVLLLWAVALLAQTAMGAAVRSDAAAEGAALEASPAAIRPEVFPAVAPLEVSPVAVSRVAMVVGVAEAADESQLINPKEDHLILFFCPVVDRHS